MDFTSTTEPSELEGRGSIIIVVLIGPRLCFMRLPSPRNLWPTRTKQTQILLTGSSATNSNTKKLNFYDFQALRINFEVGWEHTDYLPGSQPCFIREFLFGFKKKSSFIVKKSLSLIRQLEHNDSCLIILLC